MKTLLVLGAGYYHRASLLHLVRGGLRVVAVDADPRAPGADVTHRFEPLDITDAKRVLELARSEAVDGVMPMNEFGMRTHAHVTQALGLPGLDLNQAEAVVDKGAMRTVWEAAGLCQPRFRIITQLAQAGPAAEQIGFPCIIKPADSGGSGRGIIIIEDASQVAEAFGFAEPHARNGRVLIEEFIDGLELTLEGLCWRGEHRILAGSDKVKAQGLTRVATSLNYPAQLPEPVMASVQELVHAAVRAIGLRDCATHTEVIVNRQDRPYLVELGARGGGGHIFSTIVEAVSGVNMPMALAQILTGEQPDWQPSRSRGAAYRFFTPEPGRIAAINGIDQARRVEGVLDLGFVKTVGQRVGSLDNSLERAGFVVTTGTDRSSACNAADLVESIVQVDMA